MNPGYLSWILIFIWLILLSSGWKRALLREVPDWAIVLFVGGWCLLSRLQVRWRDDIQLNGTVLLLAAFVITVLLMQKSLLGAVHYVSFGMFLASVYYLMKHLGDIDPLFLPYRKPMGAAVTVALLAAMLVRRVKDQIACISFALLLGSVLYGLVHRERAGIGLGGLPFQDEWWLTVFAARIVSAAGEYVGNTVREAADRWKGMRK